jgi:hypothetical protein
MTKEEALALLEEHRPDFIAAARATAWAIWHETKQPVTVDAVRKLCPPPPDIDPRRPCRAVLMRVGQLAASKSHDIDVNSARQVNTTSARSAEVHARKDGAFAHLDQGFAIHGFRAVFACRDNAVDRCRVRGIHNTSRDLMRGLDCSHFFSRSRQVNPRPGLLALRGEPARAWRAVVPTLEAGGDQVSGSGIPRAYLSEKNVQTTCAYASCQQAGEGYRRLSMPNSIGALQAVPMRARCVRAMILISTNVAC